MKKTTARRVIPSPMEEESWTTEIETTSKAYQCAVRGLQQLDNDSLERLVQKSVLPWTVMNHLSAAKFLIAGMKYARPVSGRTGIPVSLLIAYGIAKRWGASEQDFEDYASELLTMPMLKPLLATRESPETFLSRLHLYGFSPNDAREMQSAMKTYSLQELDAFEDSVEGRWWKRSCKDAVATPACGKGREE